MSNNLSDITDLNSQDIKYIINTNPVLIGKTYTAKQFFEDTYEYNITNKEFIGRPINNKDINTWEDVQIIDNDGKITNLVYPWISSNSYFSVYIQK